MKPGLASPPMPSRSIRPGPRRTVFHVAVQGEPLTAQHRSAVVTLNGHVNVSNHQVAVSVHTAGDQASCPLP